MNWFVLAVAVVSVALTSDPAFDDARHVISYFVHDAAQIDGLIAHLKKRADQTVKALGQIGDSKGMEHVLTRNVIANLEAKRTMDQTGPALPMSISEIERTVIDYEAFKLETYVTSGVFPKRYFGYFDNKYDTAAYERRMRKVIGEAVDAINQYQAKHKNPVRIYDIEVAITFLAEGGALFLRERQDVINRLHPVLHVGLDDIASGFSDLPAVVQVVDGAVGTNLTGLIGWTRAESSQLPEPSDVDQGERWLSHRNGESGPFPFLRRYMTFDEALGGTAIMYLWEKNLAEKKLASIQKRPLHQRSLDEQFIIASLVYNSGNLHQPERWEMIRTFRAGDFLYRASERNAKTRSRLPILPSRTALEWLRSGHGYYDQPTEWMAAYHVLQRYGAFVAMRRFTNVFKENGSFNNPDSVAGDSSPPDTK